MDRKSITLLGIAFILLGIVAFTYRGGGDTSREKVLNIGPVQAGIDTKMNIPLSPVLGGLVLVAGILLVVVGAKNSS